MTHTVDNQIIEGEADIGRYRVQTLIQATSLITLTLTNTSPGYILLTGTTAGQIVKLGDATTYKTGHTYIIHNNSTQRITMQDNSNAVLSAVYSKYRITLILQDNSTAAGVWVFGLETSANPFWAFENGLLTWSDDTGADLLIQQFGGSGSAYVRQQSANGTKESPLPITAGQRLGGYGYYGWNSSGSNGMPSAEDLIEASEDHTPTAWGGDRIWCTIPNGSTTSTERMRLKHNGNLLVGTNTDNGFDRLQLDRGASVNFGVFEIFDDYLWTTLGSGSNPNSVVSVIQNGGANTVETTATGNNYVGLVSTATGATATGRAILDYFNGSNKIRIGSQRVILEQRVRIPTGSSAAQSFNAYIGLRSSNASGLAADALCFSHTHTTGGGNWVCRSSSGATSSSAITTVPVVDNQWYKLRIEINETRTQVDFFIDNVLVSTNITDTTIPSATAGMRPMVQIEKSVGTTARSVQSDYCYLKMFR